ncbi:TetR/AcrR family transcriptional regulator [Actinomadura craniellae]|uniref:TetR/AcrR family transcriptional regulator n=1 Tax=Actinomadura craniellae TaxID=2231787 RepID=A0A365H7E4_9ACTN|nr:TetR/AcrR family transcriptional regulator [Actinomadura craniellae]RAY14193.1 TetR/AcrR family transcriptional regulator [Actinomadura craniellae]
MTTEYGGGGDPARSIELLWGTAERPRRGPRPRLTVPQVARAAIELADTEGLGALSMRRVADHLGVTAMSLYTYVPGKAELIDVMLDTVYAEAVREAVGETVGPESPAAGWRAALERIARRNRDLYLRHPWLMQVATSRPVLGPGLIAKYDLELRALDGLDLTDVEMDLLLSLVLDYVHGAARVAVDAARAERDTGMTDAQWWQAHAPLLQRALDPDRYPVATRVGTAAGQEYQAAHDPGRAFDFGLARVLDGVAAFLRDRPTGPRP